MKVLIAEDDPIYRRLLEMGLTKWEYDVISTSDGDEAWQVLRQKDVPQLAILDWLMPGMEGVEVIKKVRAKQDGQYVYIILLTSRGSKEDIWAGFEAGADDYFIKPFNLRELHARIKVGIRILNLQNSLTGHVKKIEEALARVKQLHGLLPICAYCKKIRGDKDYWQQVESYIADHSEVQFSHGICPECYKEFVMPEIEKMRHGAETVS